METEIVALIKSPDKSNNYHQRKGDGFSLKEIKEAGKTVQLLKELNIKIDYLRRSAHEINITTLKTLEAPEKKGKKRTPFVRKEKKRTAFKPKKKKKKEKPSKVKETIPEKPIPKKSITKEKAPLKKKAEVEKKSSAKVEAIEKAIEKPKPASEEEGMPLVKLSGLGVTTAKKFENLGVTSIESLIKEDSTELAKLIKGCSDVKIATWQKEGKKLLEESK